MHGDTLGILGIICTLNPVGHFWGKKNLKGWTLQERVFLQLTVFYSAWKQVNMVAYTVNSSDGKIPLMEDNL